MKPKQINKEFVCDQCEKLFSRKSKLRAHIKNKQCFSSPGAKPKQKPGGTNAANESKETKEGPEHEPIPNDLVRSTKNLEEETIERINLQYAKDYNPLNDLAILIKGLKRIDQ